MKKNVFIGLLVLLNLFILGILFGFYNKQLIIEERSKILSDGYDELIIKYLADIKKSSDNFEKDQARLQGMMSVIFNLKPSKNDYSKIWHAGYNAGAEVSEFTEYSAYESGYMNACEDFELPVPLSPVPAKGDKN
jgi:hypothetical protein